MIAKKLTKGVESVASKPISSAKVPSRADILKSVNDRFGAITATALLESLTILEDASQKLYKPQNYSNANVILANAQMKDAMLYFKVLATNMVGTDLEAMKLLLEWSKECQSALDYKKPVGANLRTGKTK